MEKKSLRKQLLRVRQALPPDQRRVLDVMAQEALIASPWFGEARTILLYYPFRGEVATDLVAAATRSAGKVLVLPRVSLEPRKLWLHRWVGDPLPGAYGIPEPEADWPLVEPGEIDLAVVAGVAFDRAGYRLGYGGGFYDRTLPLIREANPPARFLGLAYGLQVVAELPREPHDTPMDGVVTEEGFLPAGGA